MKLESNSIRHIYFLITLNLSVIYAILVRLLVANLENAFQGLCKYVTTFPSKLCKLCDNN